MERQSINVDLKSVSPERNFASGRNKIVEQYNPTKSLKEEVANKKDSKFIVRMFDKLIGLSIFMLFFGVPLYFTGLASQGIVFEKQMYFYFWLLLGLAIWAAKGVVTGEMKIRRTPLDWPLVGFWLTYVIATIFSVDKWHSFWGSFGDPSRGLLSVTAYLVVYYFILSNFSTKRLRLILTAIITSGAILSIWTTLMIFGVKFLSADIARFAPMSLTGTISSLGAIFSILIPIITVTILKIADSKTIKKVWKRILEVLLLMLLSLDFFLILALYNYIPWLGFFIGIVIFLIFILAQIVRPNLKWTWLPMSVFVVAMILRMIGVVSIVKVNLPVEVSLNYKTSTDVALASVKNNFFVGSGPATYGYDFSLHKPKNFNLNAFYNLRFSQGTGLLAEAIPTIGVIGTFFLVILVLIFIGSQMYLLYKNKDKNKLYSLGIFSAVAILLTDVLIARVDGLIILLTVIFSALSLAVIFFESSSEENNINLSLKASPKFALALAFIFMVISAGVAFLFVFFGKVYAADIYSGKAIRVVNTSMPKALRYLSKAVKLNPRESTYYNQAGQLYMSLANKEAMKSKGKQDINKIRQDLNNSIAATTQAKKMSENSVASVEALALVYENSGLYVPNSLKLAEDNYKKAQKLEPHNPIYDLKLGQIKVAMAKQKKDKKVKKQLITEARDLFQKSVDEKSNYAIGHHQLALADEALNQLDQAIESELKAVNINPRNTAYLLTLGRMYQERNKNNDVKVAEQVYKQVVALNRNSIDGHFYLGVFYEKNKQKDQAKIQYNKVLALLKERHGQSKTIKQIEKMIDNINKGIKNTPETLGIVSSTTTPKSTSKNSAVVPSVNNKVNISPQSNPESKVISNPSNSTSQTNTPTK